MSFNRYARRKDTSHDEIVGALRAAGWSVYEIGRPVDLLAWKQGKGFRLLECKTPSGKAGKARVRKDQEEQNIFIERTGTPRVTCAQEALLAVGEKILL